MEVLVYDFRWEDEKTCKFQASFASKFGQKFVKIGDALSIEIRSAPRCAGSVFDGKFAPCPQNFIGKSRCELCRTREKNYIFTMFDGFDRGNFSAEELEKIAGRHVAYLALFDKNLIKVGVSALERKILRQIEQGSHFALHFAQTPDGILARQIETILRKSGISDKIKPGQKKDFLAPEISREHGEKLLRDLLAEKLSALDSHPHLKKFVLDPPEFRDFSEIYHLRNFTKNPKPFHSIALDENESVSGKIIAIKGPFIVLELPDEIVSICAKDLQGRLVSFDEKPPGLRLNSAFQSSMF